MKETLSYTTPSNPNRIALTQTEQIGTQRRSRRIERDQRGDLVSAGEWGRWFTPGSKAVDTDGTYADGEGKPDMQESLFAPIATAQIGEPMSLPERRPALYD
jgi:hypothetical protein